MWHGYISARRRHSQAGGPDLIGVAQTGGCLTITINRPDKANALTEAMLSKLADTVLAATDPVLVLTGAGRVFSAGADLEDVRGGTLATSPEWERLSAAVARFEGLSIAALNGSCAGGALGMVLACDLRIAVPTSKFFYPVMKMGVLPQPSDPARLRALVGKAAAKRILLAGVRIEAPEALALGLIDEVCSADAMPDRLTEWMAPAVAGGAARVMAIKQMIDAP